jgi:hypothetical protein
VLSLAVALASVAAAPSYGFAEPKARLSVEPSQSKLRLGEGVQLKASLKGRSGPVRWAVDGVGVGTITLDGYYQAPSYGSTPATIRVKATADGEPPVAAEALIFLHPVAVEIKPERTQLSTGETFHFRAKVADTADQRVIWSVDGGGAHGQINESGLYTAPDHFRTPGNITVRATSAADPSKVATATVHLGKVQIKIRQKEITLKHGESRRFEAEVTGSTNTDVIWSVLGEDQGQISPSGLYATPAVMATPAVVTIIAASAADPTKRATARVRVEAVQLSSGGRKQAKGKRSTLHRVAKRIYRVATPNVVRLIIPFDPVDFVVRGPDFQGKSGKRYVPLGGAVNLDAAVRNSSNNNVKWELLTENLGELTEDGVYFAPDALTTPRVVQIRATSLADPTKTALHTLHVPPVVVQAQKQAYVCLMDGAIQLQARVENAENDQVKWTVEEGAAFGSVSDNGLYHPPASLTTPAVIRVRACSVADPTKYAIIQVSVPEVRLELSASSDDVRPGRTVRLKTKVEGCNSRAGDVVWKLTPEIGSITPDGIYTAPEDGGAQVVQVSASLKADPTKMAATSLRLTGR